MDKKEYFRISEEKKLPLRCPCIKKCSRYNWTAYLIGTRYYNPRGFTVQENMIEMEILDYRESLENKLNSGEQVEIVGGGNNFYISYACPEIMLFPNSNKPSLLDGFAVSNGSFDIERRTTPKYQPGDSCHYTECAEYSQYIQTNKYKKGNNRKYIPSKFKVLLQKEISNKCPFCENEEVEHFEIHHIDEDRTNNDYKNLIMLCRICHSKITKGDISMEDVLEKKFSLKSK